jgi:hypothetical protein
MQLKCYLMCFAFLFIAAPIFAVKLTNASDGYNTVQVYNNSDSSFFISGMIRGGDLANLSQKFDCGDQYSKMCAGLLPEDENIYIDPGKEHTFTVISKIKSMRNIKDFVRGAIVLGVMTEQHYTDDKIVLPVEVDISAAHIKDRTVDTNNQFCYIGASTESINLEHPKYIMSVTFHYSRQDSRQTIMVIVNNAPDLTHLNIGGR